MKLKIVMLRHGATKGNLEKRYVGSTDEDLLESERCRLLYAAPDFHGRYLGNRLILPVVSPMKRCRQTLEMLLRPEYKPMQAIVVPDFREMSFGDFEYKNYRELNGNPDYQRYIDSGGTAAFPNGESRAEFVSRVSRAFVKTVRNLEFHEDRHPEERTGHPPDSYTGSYSEGINSRRFKLSENSSCSELLLLLVVHGGTIMAILDRFSEPHQDYFHWQCRCLEGYTANLEILNPDRTLVKITEAEPFHL